LLGLEFVLSGTDLFIFEESLTIEDRAFAHSAQISSYYCGSTLDVLSKGLIKRAYQKVFRICLLDRIADGCYDGT
jgi:hypothetical protein